MPNPLQILRRKSAGSHLEDNCPQHTAHNNYPNTFSINVTATTTTSISKSNSLSSFTSRKSSTNRKHRHSSLPLPTRRPGLNHNGSSPSERQPLKETNKSRFRRLKLRTPRLSAPAASRSVESTTIAKLRIDSSQEDTATTATTATKERLKLKVPMPLDPPDDNLQSEKAYQREGRKSVLSSLGSRAMGKKDKMENNIGTRRWTFSYQYPSNNQQPGYHDTASVAASSPYVSPQAHVHEDEPLSNPDCVEAVSRTTKSRTMIPIPTSASTPYFTKIEAGRKRHSLSSLVSHNGRLSSRILSSRFPREETAIEKGQADDTQQNPMARKVQPRAHATRNPRRLPQLPTEKGSRLSGTVASLDGMTSKMPQPIDNVESRRFYWTGKSSEALKKSSYDTNPTMPPIHQSDEITYRRTSRTHTLTSTRTRERSRHRTRADRMAQQPTSPLSESQPQEEDNELSHPLHQVSQPQPIQYWLGRFVTLTNAFHYEDSFNQPDTATGFGMLSSYSRPDGSAERNLANYRIKRAFMVLENACLTEEASRSLRAFQSEYIVVKGDRWMG